MGGGELVVGIVSEQVHSGSYGTNYSEWANQSVHEGFNETTLLDLDVNKDFAYISM